MNDPHDPVEKLHQRERDQERHRLRELGARDLEVEAQHGPRPLEGFAGGHTTWTGRQIDAAAREEHAQDVERSRAESEARVRRMAPGHDEP